MDSNTDSAQPPQPPGPPGPPEGPELPALPDDLAGLAAVVDELADQDLDRLSDRVRAERVQGLRWLVDRLEGQWLKELAGVDARGAAGADRDQHAPATASWLRQRLRLAPAPPPS